MRAITDTGRTVRLPTHVVETVKRAERARQLLTQALEREPENWEIALHLGCEVEQIQSLDLQTLDPTSLETVIHDENGLTTLEDYLEDVSVSPSDDATDRLDRAYLSHVIHDAIQELQPREAKILTLRYGLEGNKQLTLEALAARFSLTRERVRQIESQAIDKLRQNKAIRNVFEEV
jgi:RNA polymerase primary sigma factor